MRLEQALCECDGNPPARRRMLLVVALASVALVRTVSAQSDPPQDPSLRNGRASAIREPCIPTAADGDPDVFKRPCFVEALGISRQAFGAYAGFTGIGKYGVELASERIPALSSQAFRSALTETLNPECLPESWEGVDLRAHAACPMKLITEVRVPGGAPTLVRQEPDCNVEITELKDHDDIQAAWTVDGIDVLPRTSYFADQPIRRLVIRLRVHGAERLHLGERPEHFTRSAKDFATLFDPVAFHALLSKVFRVPFESSDDFYVSGFDTEYEGVRVFHGEILSREWSQQFREDRSRRPSRWWDEMRLLVTDSDPQYFCVEIVIRDADHVEELLP